MRPALKIEPTERPVLKRFPVDRVCRLGLVAGILMLAETLSSALASSGDLYVSDFGNGLVLKFDAAGTPTTFASGLTGPFGLAFDRGGNLFVADKDTNSIFKFTPAGTKSTFASDLNVPTALAFDAAGNLFVANFSGNAILKFAPDGSKVTFASGLSNPSGLAFDVAGNLYESDYASGMIFKFTPAGMKTMFASGLGHPEEIAFDSDGNLFVGEFNTGSILKFGPGGAKTTFASGLSGSWGLAFNSAGDLFEADSTSGMVLRFTPQGAKTTFASGIGVPTFLAFEPPSGMPLNISTRMRVLTGDQVLIGGFIITGSDPKRVIIRGMGPSLNGVGVTLSDPTLELHQGNTTLATNDNWKIDDQTGQSQEAAIRATTIPPSNDLESAIVISLSPGSYTAILAGKNGGTGVGLVEVYDLAQGANSKLANISTRGFVDTGDNVMIGGLIVGGGDGTAKVIVRALGPSVPVPGPLGDPTLELHDVNGATIATNDNWKIDDQTGQSQEAAIRATTIPPPNDLESALIATLAPGNYTAIVRGKNNTTGIGLVEVYDLQ
jgi:hypothetical protein